MLTKRGVQVGLSHAESAQVAPVEHTVANQH